MTLQEAWDTSKKGQVIARKKWRESGILMHIISPGTPKEIFDLELTPESIAADDWEIFEEVK
jgi:hypothetical protein